MRWRVCNFSYQDIGDTGWWRVSASEHSGHETVQQWRCRLGKANTGKRGDHGCTRLRSWRAIRPWQTKI